jgi:hypothetical protein
VKSRHLRFTLAWVAGYSILTSGHLCGQSQGDLRVEETLRVDGYAMDLVSIAHAVEGPAGSVVVSQGMKATIRQFLPGGQSGWTVGGPGDGPAEFRSLSKIGRLLDTIWVVDSRAGRISFFDSLGRLVRDARLPLSARPPRELAATEPSFGFVGPIAAYSDGSFLAVLALRMPAAEGNQMYYAHLDGEGTILHMVATSTSTRGFFVKTNGGSAGGMLPFQHRTFVSISAGGSYLAVVTPQIVGERGSIAVHVLSATGDTLFARSVPASAVKIPSDSLEQATHRGSLSFPPNLRDDYFEQAKKKSLGVFPFVEGAVVTDDGRVWLRLRAEGGGRPHLLLDASGETLGKIELPTTVRVIGAFGDSLIGADVDEFGVESLVLYVISP